MLSDSPPSSRSGSPSPLVQALTREESPISTPVIETTSRALSKLGFGLDSTGASQEGKDQDSASKDTQVMSSPLDEEPPRLPEAGAGRQEDEVKKQEIEASSSTNGSSSRAQPPGLGHPPKERGLPSRSSTAASSSSSRGGTRRDSKGRSFEYKETLDARTRDMQDGSRIINQYRLVSVLGQGAYGTVHRACLLDDPTSEFAIKEFGKTRLRKTQRAANFRRPLLRGGRPVRGRGSEGAERGSEGRAAGPSPGGDVDGKGKGKEGSGGDDKDHRLGKEMEAAAAEQGLGQPQQDAARKAGQNGGDPLSLIRHEIAILKKLNHPNVVQLYEVLDDPSRDGLYMVFEYCPDGPVINVKLHQQVEPLPEDVARKYLTQIVLGVEYLHSSDVVHRDIKPDNILLADGKQTCKIVDFGVSEMFLKPGDDTLKKSAGSPAFMSPEQCSAGHGDLHGKRDDIWSLGVTFFCMVAGRLPFDKSQFLELYESIKMDEPGYPSHLSPSCLDLLKRFLEKDAEKRITMPEIREHPWLLKGGNEDLVPETRNLSKVVLDVTEEEIGQAISRIASVFTIARAVHRFKKGASGSRRSTRSPSTGSTGSGSLSHVAHEVEATAGALFGNSIPRVASPDSHSDLRRPSAGANSPPPSSRSMTGTTDGASPHQFSFSSLPVPRPLAGGPDGQVGMPGGFPGSDGGWGDSGPAPLSPVTEVVVTSSPSGSDDEGSSAAKADGQESRPQRGLTPQGSSTPARGTSPIRAGSEILGNGLYRLATGVRRLLPASVGGLAVEDGDKTPTQDAPGSSAAAKRQAQKQGMEAYQTARRNAHLELAKQQREGKAKEDGADPARQNSILGGDVVQTPLNTDLPTPKGAADSYRLHAENVELEWPGPDQKQKPRRPPNHDLHPPVGADADQAGQGIKGEEGGAQEDEEMPAPATQERKEELDVGEGSILAAAAGRVAEQQRQRQRGEDGEERENSGDATSTLRPDQAGPDQDEVQTAESPLATMTEARAGGGEEGSYDVCDSPVGDE